MTGTIAIDSKVRIKNGQFAGKEGLVKQSNAHMTKVSFFLIGRVREDIFNNGDLTVLEDGAKFRAERIADSIINGILVHGFENDADAEKVLRGQRGLVVAALTAEIGG